METSRSKDKKLCDNKLKTTTYTIFCLWYATLFTDKKIMICANKLATAIEIMDRIRKAYENLPFWIKPGILTYNKGEVEFANGSVIRACSTSSSAARGSSCNCVHESTNITIRLLKSIKLNVKMSFLKKLLRIFGKKKDINTIAINIDANVKSLHDSAINTYVESIQPLFPIEVLSENEKWNKITSFNITEKSQLYKIKTQNRELLCTKNHILIDEHGKELFAIDSNNRRISTKNGIETVISVEKTSLYDHAYDLSLEEKTNHLYYCNGMLSHNCLVVDEMAFLPKNVMESFWSSVVPIVSSSKSSKIITVSTPNGADGLYYELWQQANSKDARNNAEGWKPFRIHWWETGGIRDENWKKQQIASIGMERWKQEFECDFLTSTTKRLIPDDILEKYRIKLGELKAQKKELLEGKKHQIMSEDETKLFELTMWHEFDSSRTYVATGDAAEGGGGDSSVLYVWDITDLRDIKMCAKFDSDKVSLVEFAFVTSKVLALYGNPYYICERNGVGSGYLDSLRLTYSYQNIVTEGKNGEPGVYSHAHIKSKACLWARDMMTTEGFGFTLYDKDLVDEFSSFVKKDTKNSFVIYTALAGAHDDHIMAFIWLTYLLNNENIEKYFVVCETFADSLGNNYARTVMPQKAYTSEQIKAATNDPIYKDFLDFKEELTKKYGLAMKAEKAERDVFNQATYDPYFGGGDGPSWNIPSMPNGMMQNAQDLNPNNRMPAFFVN